MYPEDKNGAERKSFVNTLHKFGYNTFFAGKYLNQYGRKEVGGLEHVPPGWDWWIGLEGNSRYYDYTLSVNGSREYHGFNPSTDYLTNVIKKRALEFLNTTMFNPFFMMLSTPACHAPFDSEPKYYKNFSKYHAPRTKNFNIVNDHSKHWLLRLGEQPLRKEIINKMDEIYRKRLRTLMSVDAMIKEIYNLIKDKGLLNSTYILFTSDNENLLDYPITNIDIAPTILDLAGIDIPKHFDGESLKPLLQKEEIYSETTRLSPPLSFWR
ncbi:N-acetylglucosamine-6-sulfatase [Armadillidium vulgare]|nr:N-acetylglucosamine-6-sulfatase [Armadillidium vulgare]